MIDALITGILAVIMFSIGLSLRFDHFRRLFSAPRVLLLGLCLQLIALPLLAFAVCYALLLPPAFATGVMILAACPGGITSNFISYLLKANSALSVSLTICNSALSTLTVPLIVNLALASFWTGDGIGRLPVLPTAGRIFLIVLVPILIGMLFRSKRPKTAARLQPGFRWLGVLLLGIVFGIKLLAPPESGGSALTLEEVVIIFPASLLINVGALSFGSIFGRLFGFGRNDQLTLGVEAGIQNTSLAFLIASAILHNDQMLKPALVYAMFTFFTSLAYGLWLKPGMWSNLRKELVATLRQTAQ